jgi:hypothetical protein
MLDTEKMPPLDSEERARSRVWERVQAGMAVLDRRRRRRAAEALALGAAMTTAIVAVISRI